MGHGHIDELGRFQSDKYPDLSPDTLLVSFKDPLARKALSALAIAYNNKDHDFASDIRRRLSTIEHDAVPPSPENTPIGKGT